MTNQMKFSLMLPIAFLLIGSSCGKKADVVVPANANTVAATVNGANLNFSTGAFAEFETLTTGAYTANLLVINGETGTDGNQATIGLTVAFYGSVASGTYVSSDTTPPVSNSQLIYAKDTASSQITDPFITDNSGHYLTTVVITSITSTHVQGTFNGTLINSLGSSGTEAVTNGTFDLAIK